jgi:hypothetical protein
MKVRFLPIESIGFESADIVVAHRISLSSIEQIETIEKFCKQQNAKFIYDLDDDLLALSADHTQAEVYSGYRPVVVRALRAAHQIWSSTEVLAARCRQYGANVITVPNSLDHRIWSAPNARSINTKVTRFLYMGAPTHRQDLYEIALPAFVELKRQLGDRVDFTVVGVSDSTDQAMPYSILKVPLDVALSYPAFVSWLQAQGPFDIGLAPMIDTTFNRSKSNIKQLEYAALGLPTIAADLPPYRDTPHWSRGVVFTEPSARGFWRAMHDLACDSSKLEQFQLMARNLAHEILESCAENEPRKNIIENLIEDDSLHQPASKGNGSSHGTGSRRKRSVTPPLDGTQLRKAASLIRGSGLFDTAWYLHTYPDVGTGGIDPLIHYLTYGHIEKKNPSLAFDASAYLMLNPDVARQGMNALLHYVKYGLKEGRMIRPVLERSEEYLPATIEPGPIVPLEHCIALYSCKGLERENNWAPFHSTEKRLAKRFGLAGFCYLIDHIAVLAKLDESLARDDGGGDAFLFCIALDASVALSQSTALSSIASLFEFKTYLCINGRPVVLIRQAADGTPGQLRAQLRILMKNQSDLFLVRQDLQAGQSLGFDAVLLSSQISADHINCTAKSLKPSFPLVCLEHRDLQRTATSSPATYQEYLEQACLLARKHSIVSPPIIFIQGWNLAQHDDQLRATTRFGYAYLNATAKASQSIDPSNAKRQLRIGVTAHVFYEDLWSEIAAHLQAWRTPFRLYATVPEDNEQQISTVIRREWPNAIVMGVPNRGRDMAPFLQQARLAEQDGIDVICKIHTKKSRHRTDGAEWRRDLYDKLLGDAKLPQAVIEAFRLNSALGMIAPQGHLIAGELYWGANATRVYGLAKQLGYEGPLEPFSFAAGSMFWIRNRALKPILNLDLSLVDFEPDARQVDGTLAHALERLFPIAAKMGGYRVADTRVLQYSARTPDYLRSKDELAYLSERSRNYRYAPRVRTY